MTNENQFEFKTDVKQLLDLVTHSLYSHKDIFLRELISNASDAIDKVKFESLTNKDLLEGNADWKIDLSVDKENKTFTIADNGIGMTREDLLNHIGTIAKSGTQEFLEKLKDAQNKDNPDLIGQFGVGFYSAFMVADTVTIKTRVAGGPGVQWQSTGEGQFEIIACDKKDRGTEIILNLKEDSLEFLEEQSLRAVVKKYSDFVAFPICMDVEKDEYPLKDGKPDYEATPTKKITNETLNSREAIWVKQKSQVKKDDYNNFYKHISHDFNDPLKVIHYHAEGTMEFKALMYLPAKAPMDLYTRESLKGLHLYINRVFIMDDCQDLMPEYLRFIRGVVDSSDLPLNVSREILQDNPQLANIRKNLVQKVLSELKKLKDKDFETYVKFYQEFGPVLKEGLHSDFGNRDKITDLLLFETTQTNEGEIKSLADYVKDMGADQKEIYYIIAEDKVKALSSPQLEIFRSKNIEVLLLTDKIDEWIVPHLTEYDKKPIKPVHQGEVEPEKDQKEEIEKKSAEYKDLLHAIRVNLQDEIKEVRFSTKLIDSACCLSLDEGGITAQMEQMFKAMGQEVPKQKKILELNPNHSLIKVMDELVKKDTASPQLSDYITLLYEQALLTEGSQLKDPLNFAKKISELMVAASKAA